MSEIADKKIIRVLYILALVTASLALIFPFIIPIIFGGTLSLAMFPVMLRLEKVGLKRKAAAKIVTGVFTFIISIPLFFFLIKGTITVTQQLEKLARSEKLKDQGVSELVTGLRSDLIKVIYKYASKFEMMDFLSATKIDHYLESVTRFLLNFFQSLATSLPLFFMFFLIMVLCIYSFLVNASEVRKFFQGLFGFDDACTDQLIHIFIKDSRQVYLSNIITGGVQSLIVALGVSFLGQGDFFLVFFVTLILSFIPVIGAAPVAFIFAAVAFLKDNTTASIILVILGMVTGVADNILRPWLASFGESRIPPVVAFIFVIGGALLFGFPGLFLGLLVGSIAYDTLPVFWKEVIRSRD